MSKSKSKRKTLAVLAAVAAFAAVSASAASLGGLNSKNLGADANVVASCDTTGVDVSYNTSYVPAAKEFQVTSVQLSNVDNACSGQTANVVLSDSTGAQIGSGSVGLSLPTGTTTQAVPLTANVSAKAVTGVAVVIAN